jgi:uncharacterized membrane protein HdeD (DUF308 family)
MKYLDSVLLILAGVVMLFLRVINHVYLAALNAEQYYDYIIENGRIEEIDLTAWTYTPLTYIIGALLIASGIARIIKEAQNEKSK